MTMKSEPLLSVIVPVYNVEKYLDECVRSIRSQTYKNLEIILVNDGSSDSCPAMCNRYATEDKRIRVIHKQNEGLGMARNSGLEVATGEYITFVDSDDYIDEDTYELLLPLLTDNKLDCVRFNFSFLNCNGTLSGEKKRTADIRIIDEKWKLRKMALLLFERHPLADEKEFYFDGSVWGGIYRSEIFKKYNITFPSERELMSEDYVFNFELLQKINRIGFTPISFYNYRFNPNSLSKSLKIDRAERAHKYCLFMRRRMKETGYTDAETNYLMGYYVCNLIDSFINICNSEFPWEKKKCLIKDILSTDYCREVFKKYDAKSRLHSWYLVFYRMMKYKIYGVYLFYKHSKNTFKNTHIKIG